MLREEIGNGPDTKAPGAAGDGSGAYSPGDYESDVRAKEFLSTERTGRRNALTDLLDHHVETGTLDLPNRFEKLTVETDQSNSSMQDQNSPSTSKQQG